MSLHKKAIIAGLVFAIGSVGAVVVAQQPQANNPAVTTQQPRARMTRRMMRRRTGMRAFRALRQLNLTDQQKQQARTIMQTNRQSDQAQREELRQLMQKRRAGTLDATGEARAKELRGELRVKRESTRTQLAAILTPEQKAKLEEMRKERRANREQFRTRKQTSN
jgi:Spy/CpxP family protein refolding chaperone